jgi:peroxiredoxin Q/BCP
MKAFQRDIANFEKLDAQVLGVSTDTLESHHEFAAKLGLSFPLITDDGTIRKLYGSSRITYLIDPTGIIRLIHKGMPDNATLARAISNLQSY